MQHRQPVPLLYRLGGLAVEHPPQAWETLGSILTFFSQVIPATHNTFLSSVKSYQPHTTLSFLQSSHTSHTQHFPFFSQVIPATHNTFLSSVKSYQPHTTLSWPSPCIWLTFHGSTRFVSTKTEWDYLKGWIKNDHIRKNLTQNGEPERYSWGTQKKKKKKKFGLPHSACCPIKRKIEDKECLPLLSVSKGCTSLSWSWEWCSHEQNTLRRVPLMTTRNELNTGTQSLPWQV